MKSVDWKPVNPPHTCTTRSHLELCLEGALSSGRVLLLVPLDPHPEVSSTDLSVPAGDRLQHGVVQEDVLLL